MKVYLIYKRKEDNEEDVFMSFHTIKKLVELAIFLYKDVYIRESEMTEDEYERFKDINKNKELLCLKHHMHVGCVILRRLDLNRLLSDTVYIYDKEPNDL